MGFVVYRHRKDSCGGLPFLSRDFPFFVGSHAQLRRSPFEHARVMACTTPADDTAYTKAASREPTEAIRNTTLHY